MKKSYGVDRRGKMSDSNDTLPNIYKFSSDIVRPLFQAFELQLTLTFNAIGVYALRKQKTSQNGQTHSNNLSDFADEMFECV